MNLLEDMNAALFYIEEHLDDEIDIKVAAGFALCSEYHFTRMFSFLAGIPLSEYIRRRRLTLAAFKLQGSQHRIIDVALEYGYTSPDAFTKAFQQLHGVTPSEARTAGTPLKAFPRMTFQLTIRGGSEMNYRIEEKEAFRIVGLKKRVAIQFSGVNPEIAAMWQSLSMEMIGELKGLSDMVPSGLISSSVNFSEGRMEERGSWIIILEWLPRRNARRPTPSWRFQRLHGPCSKWWVPFRARSRMSGAGSTPNGSPLPITSRSKGRSFCGTKARIPTHQLLKVKYGFLCGKQCAVNGAGIHPERTGLPVRMNSASYNRVMVV